MKDPADILEIRDELALVKLHECRWPLWIPLKQLKRDSVKNIYLAKARSQTPEDLAVTNNLRRFLYPSLNAPDEEQAEQGENDDATETSSKPRSVARVKPMQRIETDATEADASVDPSPMPIAPPANDNADEISLEESELSEDSLENDEDDPDYCPPNDSSDCEDCPQLPFARDRSPPRAGDNQENLENDEDDPDYCPPNDSSDCEDCPQLPFARDRSPPGAGDNQEEQESPVSDSDEISEVERFPGLVVHDSMHNDVATTRNSVKRVWDRRNICLYCEKPQSTLARHLERMHGDEIPVQEALSMKKGSKERREAFFSLRNRGNYAHNVKVKQGEKDAELIPWRRNSKNKKHCAHDFLMCDGCQGFFFRKTLWKHKRSCSRRHGRRSSGRVQLEAMAQMPLEPGIPSGYQEILDSMVIDRVSIICKTDPMIKEFGLRMFRKHGKERHQKHYISGKLRELGRLVAEIQKEDPSASLTAYLSATKFSALTKAVRAICSYDEETSRYGTPSLALKLGHSLKKCASMLKAKAIKGGTDVKQIDGFIQLIEMEWGDEVSRQAHTTLHEEKWNRDDLLPLTEDLIKLQHHLTEKIELGVEKLKNEPTSGHHRALSEATLARLLLFNRRRQGEVGRLATESFEKANKVQLQPDVEATLSPFERQLSENLRRVVIRGKRGRGVPLLLTDDVNDAIELILATKEHVGVKASGYVFTNANGHPLRGCSSLKSFAESCGAKHPEVITSTNLRKHIATVSQIVNLKNNEMDQLANFLGHDIRVHREFYRLPESCTQVTRISKLLMAAESGINQYHGKGLDELEPSVSATTDPDVPQGTGSLADDAEQREQASPPSAAEQMSRAVEAPPPKRQKRMKWSDEEKAVVLRICGEYIRRGEVPGVSICTRAVNEGPALKGRTWRSVKYFCHNLIVAEKRRAE